MAVSGDTHRRTTTTLASGTREKPRLSSLRGPAFLIIFWALAVWPVLPVLALDEPFLDADAHQLLAVMADEVEHLRWVMGGPIADHAPIKAHQVSTHEVYFQALTLLEKTNRLSFELIRERALPPAASTNGIRSEDVREVLSAALERIRTIQQVLGVGRDPVLPPPVPQGTETDLFMGLLHTNRQVNLLLDRRYSPSDVFWQVTVAVSFADAILAQNPSSGPPPAAPELQAGKRPADVFGRLVACYALVHRIGDRLGLRMLEFAVTPVGEYEILPSDVYDIASLLVSELTYIHQHLPEAPSPQKVYRYGGKFPSDVFQRAGILQRQLLLILAR